MTKLAVLDIGTNSIHLVLAEVGPDLSYTIVDRFKDMTRLGDGSFASRRLSDQAMARGFEVIRNLVTLARNKGYDRIEAIATSAVREARNGGEFIEGVAKQTGLTVRVISGAEEARLIFLGVRHSIALSDRPTLVVDVGGGSVELMVGNREAMLYARSLKLGAIRMKDLYLTRTPPSKAMLRDMHAAIERHLKAALQAFETERYDGLVATSGMAGNLTEVIYLRRTGHPPPQLHLAAVSLKEVQEVEAVLAASSVKARLAIPGLDPKRVDTLLPAAAVLRILMELVGRDELTISDKAIREGMIYDFIERHREASVLNGKSRMSAGEASSIWRGAAGRRKRIPCMSPRWRCSCSIRPNPCTVSGSRNGNGWNTPRCCTTSAISSTPGNITSTPIT